ncbi:hypothetical protein [Glaciihabitans sp. UYNi722]|uniref:hypothetical protein n=1 Tax=Glaciihabitans sp. UYNi722 TaxID=3156344 RepID=UPI003394F0EE
MGFFDAFRSKPKTTAPDDPQTGCHAHPVEPSTHESRAAKPQSEWTLEDHAAQRAEEDEAAQFRGKPYVDWVPQLDKLRSEKRDDELLELLVGILDATDRHATVTGQEPAQGYYKQAAILYRRRGDIPAEIEVIERWERACPPDYRPGLDGWSTVRKARARELLAGDLE